MRSFFHLDLVPRLSLCAALLALSSPAQAQSASAGEDTIRAALVERLTMFVDWPGWKMDANHPQFNVCIIGSDPIGPALDEAFRNKTISQKNVSFTHLQRLDKAQDCHVLYVGANATREVQREAASLQQAAVLTVSDRADVALPAQVVGLPRDDNKVRIEVNLKTATESKLVISSRLLHLATITEMP